MSDSISIGYGMQTSKNVSQRLVLTQRAYSPPLKWYTKQRGLDIFQLEDKAQGNDARRHGATGVQGVWYSANFSYPKNNDGLLLFTEETRIRGIDKNPSGVLILVNPAAPYISVNLTLTPNSSARFGVINAFCGHGYVLDRDRAKDMEIYIPKHRVGNADAFDPNGNFNIETLDGGSNYIPTFESLDISKGGETEQVVIEKSARRTIKLRKR